MGRDFKEARPDALFEAFRQFPSGTYGEGLIFDRPAGFGVVRADAGWEEMSVRFGESGGRLFLMR